MLNASMPGQDQPVASPTTRKRSISAAAAPVSTSSSTLRCCRPTALPPAEECQLMRDLRDQGSDTRRRALEFELLDLDFNCCRTWRPAKTTCSPGRPAPGTSSSSRARRARSRSTRLRSGSVRLIQRWNQASPPLMSRFPTRQTARSDGSHARYRSGRRPTRGRLANGPGSAHGRARRAPRGSSLSAVGCPPPRCRSRARRPPLRAYCLLHPRKRGDTALPSRLGRPARPSSTLVPASSSDSARLRADRSSRARGSGGQRLKTQPDRPA